MSTISVPVGPTPIGTSSIAGSGAEISISPDQMAGSAEGNEFHSMMEEDPVGATSGGMLGMIKGVDSSRRSAESALVQVVTTGDPSRIYDATAAMARFNLQTLVLNKMASKIGQAVDRLTNLQ